MAADQGLYFLFRLCKGSWIKHKEGLGLLGRCFFLLRGKRSTTNIRDCDKQRDRDVWKWILQNLLSTRKAKRLYEDFLSRHRKNPTA